MESPLIKPALLPSPFLAGLLRLPSRPRLNQQQQRKPCCHDNSGASRFFGRALDSQPTVEVPGLGPVPALMAACCHHLAGHLTVEGLFRVEAPRSRLQELRRRIDGGQGVGIGIIGEATPARDAACALKAWLRELPEPLLPPSLARELAEAGADASDIDGSRARDLLRRRCRPPTVTASQLRALRHLCGFLAQVAQHSALNRMDASNLATCLGPCLLRHVDSAAASPASPRDAVARLNAAAALLIRHHRELGEHDDSAVCAAEPSKSSTAAAAAAAAAHPVALSKSKSAAKLRGRSESCSGGGGSGGAFAALRAAVSRFASRSRSRSRSPGHRRGRPPPLPRHPSSVEATPPATPTSRAAPLSVTSLKNLVSGSRLCQRHPEPLIGGSGCRRRVDEVDDAERRRLRQFLLNRLATPSSPSLHSPSASPSPSPSDYPSTLATTSSSCHLSSASDSRRRRLLRCRRKVADDEFSPRDSLRALRLRGGIRRQRCKAVGGSRWPWLLSPSLKSSLLRSEGLLTAKLPATSGSGR